MISTFNKTHQAPTFFGAEPSLPSRITFPPLPAPALIHSRLQVPAAGSSAHLFETSPPVKSQDEGVTPSSSKGTASESPAEKKLRLAGSCLACVKGHRGCRGLPGQTCQLCAMHGKVCSRDPNRRGAQEFVSRGAQKLEQVLAREGRTIEDFGKTQPSGAGEYVKLERKKRKAKDLSANDGNGEADASAPPDEIAEGKRSLEQPPSGEDRGDTVVSSGKAAPARPRKRSKKSVVSAVQDPSQEDPVMPPLPVSAAPTDTIYTDLFRPAPMGGAPLPPTSISSNLLQTPQAFPLPFRPFGINLMAMGSTSSASFELARFQPSMPQHVPNAPVAAPQTPAGLQGTLCPVFDTSEILDEFTDPGFARTSQLRGPPQSEPNPGQAPPTFVSTENQQASPSNSTGDDDFLGDEYFSFDKFGSSSDLAPSSEGGSLLASPSHSVQYGVWDAVAEELGRGEADMDAVISQMLREYDEAQALTLLL